MSKFTLQSIDAYGELVYENSVTLIRGDKLILRYAPDTTLEDIHNIHQLMVRSFEESKDIITIPNTVELSILKVR